jgi:hypothetical protein
MGPILGSGSPHKRLPARLEQGERPQGSDYRRCVDAESATCNKRQADPKTTEGELHELLEDFSDGRIQFAFAKLKDPNSGLPKSVLISWCGEGVPERTKGYFNTHRVAVSKLLHVRPRRLQ